MAAIAAVLLYAGGLEALQTASLISALPFTVLLVLMLWSFTKIIRRESPPIKESELQRFKRMEQESRKQRNRNS